MKAYFFFIFPVGVYITEDNPTSPGLSPKRKPSNTLFFWSLFPKPPKRTKNRIKTFIFLVGENPNGFKSIPQTPLAHQKILISFFPTSLYTPHFSLPHFSTFLNGNTMAAQSGPVLHGDDMKTMRWVNSYSFFFFFFWLGHSSWKAGLKREKRVHDPLTPHCITVCSC